MKYLGLFSGKIYEESEKSSMEECGYQISDKDAENDEYVKGCYITKHIMSCMSCFGCPASKRK